MLSLQPQNDNMIGAPTFSMVPSKLMSVKIQKDFSQATPTKPRKVAFLPQKNRLIWSGYSEGRCVALWKRSDEDSDLGEPFEERCRLELGADSLDMCSFLSDVSCVSLNDGRILIFNNTNDELKKVKEFQRVHGKGSSRVLCVSNEDNLISGSSNGSIAKICVESGNVSSISEGNSGVRSICTLSGETLLATGHSAGQLLIWDCRSRSTKPCMLCVPSKRRLDAVTTLTNHPAQSTLISFGTNLGSVGFCDVRGSSHGLIINSFDVTTTAITQVEFHPDCGDHLVCASLDGSLVHWDVSSVVAEPCCKQLPPRLMHCLHTVCRETLSSRHLSAARLSAWETDYSGLCTVVYASTINLKIRLESTNLSTGTRQSPWLSETLSQSVELDTLRCPSFGAVNSFTIRGTTVVAAIDVCLINAYENVSFPIGSPPHF